MIPRLHWHNLEPEGVILSHEHLDHRGGLDSILHIWPMLWIRSPLNWGTSSALCAWRSVAMARIAFQRALAFTR
ncbi:MBL fold metallo-hydrolase [Escherichia coli]